VPRKWYHIRRLALSWSCPRANRIGHRACGATTRSPSLDERHEKLREDPNSGRTIVRRLARDRKTRHLCHARAEFARFGGGTEVVKATEPREHARQAATSANSANPKAQRRITRRASVSYHNPTETLQGSMLQVSPSRTTQEMLTYSLSPPCISDVTFFTPVDVLEQDLKTTGSNNRCAVKSM